MPPKSFNYNTENDVEKACLSIKSSTNAVLKRIDNTERNVGCLLSGGLDSSLIAALVQKHSNKQIKIEYWYGRIRRYIICKKSS